MTSLFTDPALLARAITDRFVTPAIIGVDGWTGAGKTTLARELAHNTNGSSYDLDHALTPDQGRFMTALQIDKIAEALDRTATFMFVSGICLRQAMARPGRTAAAHIYVKRMATWGWTDEEHLAAERFPAASGASDHRLRSELRRYHKLWHPHLQADFEFHRPG